MARFRYNNIFYFIIGAVAIIYVVTGLIKLTADRSTVSDFESWGYGTTFMYAIGVIELLGAAALIIPKSRIPAIAGMGVLMLGAIGTHVINGEYYRSLLPLAMLLLLISLFMMSREEIQDANLGEHDTANY